MKSLRDKIDKLHDKIIDSDANLYEKIVFDKNVDNLNINSMFTTCSLNGTVLELGYDNLFGMNYMYDNNSESIIIIYAVSHQETNKKVAEKMMNLITVLENKYIVLNETFVIKQNSVTYLLIIKNLNDKMIIGVQ